MIKASVFSDQMIRNGNVELQAREEEIRFQKMSMNEEKRAIGLLRAQLPNRRNLEEEQTTLRIQVRGFILFEPRCEKTGLRGFRPGPTQTGLHSNVRWLEA